MNQDVDKLREQLRLLCRALEMLLGVNVEPGDVIQRPGRIVIRQGSFNIELSNYDDFTYIEVVPELPPVELHVWRSMDLSVYTDKLNQHIKKNRQISAHRTSIRLPLPGLVEDVIDVAKATAKEAREVTKKIIDMKAEEIRAAMLSIKLKDEE